MRMSRLGDSPEERRQYWRSLLTPRRYLDRDFRPVFVCGASGSGTTLIGGLIFQRLHVGLYLNESARMANTGAALKMDKADKYLHVKAYYDALLIDPRISVGEVRRQILRLYRREMIYPKSSPYVMDKGPNVHLVRFPHLHGAFPEAHFVFLFRDPVEVVEGLRRKWPVVFGGSSLEDLCDFWLNMHQRFVADSESHNRQVYPLAYDTLVADPDATLARIARFAGLERRADLMPLPDKRATPGKGIRNVVEGKIIVVQDAHKDVNSSLNAEEQRQVATRLTPFYAELKTREAAFLAGLPAA